MFITGSEYDMSEGFYMHRLALNMDQVQKYKPPPNPAKDSDARFDGYVKAFGKSCWELDALEPKVISGIVEAKVNKLIDKKKLEETRKREEKERQTFYRAVKKLKGE